MTLLDFDRTDSYTMAELLEKKDLTYRRLSRSLSVLLTALTIANKNATALSQSISANLTDLQHFKKLSTQFQTLHHNSVNIAALLKLGFALIAEHDPLKMFALFSKGVLTIMKASHVVVGILDENALFSGCFYSIDPHENLHAVQASTVSILSAEFLARFISQKTVLRLSELKTRHLAANGQRFVKQAFLGGSFAAARNRVGLCYFIAKVSEPAFSLKDERLVTTIVRKFAVLYENSQLYEEIQRRSLMLFREVTERKRIEDELSQNQQRLKLALETGRMNCWDWDINSGFIYEFGDFGALFHSLTEPASNLSQGTVSHFLSRIFEEDQAKVRAKIDAALKLGEKIDMEFRIRMADDSIQWISSRANTFVDVNGQPYRMVGVSVIVTNRKNAEALARIHQTELSRVARVNSMGEMASALAHELSQPLTVINTYVSGCIHRLEGGVKDTTLIIHAMKKAMLNVELAGAIIHRMKNFVRDGELHAEKILITVVINKVVSLIHDETKDKRIRIHVDCEENLPLIYADKIQIKQVLFNLIRNAIEAMRHAKTPKPTLTIKAAKAQTLMVSVLDNGPGIALNISDLLFSPNVSTKLDSMGMGLAICRTIIEAHGGQLRVSNSPLSGACFQFTLPLMDVSDDG